MELTPEQELAARAVTRWMSDPSAPQVFRLFGCAGTGKSTLAQYLADPGRWKFAAFTGKASYVLRQKGCSEASTLHSLIYRPSGESKAHDLALLQIRIEQLEKKLIRTEDEERELASRRAQYSKMVADNRPNFAVWANSPLSDTHVEGIVIDEVSMVDEYLGRDLESFGKKILVLGDPAQLPPVGSGGYYTNAPADFMLTEIHRQARESAILRLATDVREGRGLEQWVTEWDPDVSSDVVVRHRSQFDRQDLQMSAMTADQVLVGRNATRTATNRDHRRVVGRGSLPEVGDRLVCLRNDREYGLYNGSQWVVREVENDLGAKVTDMTLTSEEDGRTTVVVPAWLHHMIGASEELKAMGHGKRDLMEFDYSYALTVHKAQGSQWNDVMLIDESRDFARDGASFARRWLYTGITRAAKRLTVVLP